MRSSAPSTASRGGRWRGRAVSTPYIDELERVRSERTDNNGATEPWPPLRPLPNASLPAVPTLPPTLLAAALRSWLVDAAERLDVPLELVAAPALVMLGGLIGRPLGLSPQRHDAWRVVRHDCGAITTVPRFLPCT